MNAPEIFEQQRLKERRSLRRFLLYAGASSLLLHGWLLGQSVPLPQGSLNKIEEDAIELTVVEEPEVKLPEEKPLEEPKIQPEPIVETPIDPQPIEAPIAVAPPTAVVPTTETPTPDPPAKSLNDALDRPESKITESDAPVAKGQPSINPGALDGIVNGNPRSTGNTNDFNRRLQGILRGTSQTPSTAPAATEPTPAATVETPAPRKRQKLRCIENCRAKYPDSLRGKNIQGDPKVTFDVDPNGNVSNVRIRKSSGNAELDAAAIEQAKKMRVSPSEAGRKDVPGTVDFQIEGTDYQRQSRERKHQRETEQSAREQEAIRNTPVSAPTNPPTNPTVNNPTAKPVDAPAAKLDAPAPQPAAPPPVEPSPAPTVEAAPPPPDPVYAAPAPAAPPPDPVYEAPAPPPEPVNAPAPAELPPPQ
jgi:TonB family protein